jgi:signal transduction histidine kinase/DNA-binding NarL/FixJ family response regulator
MALTGTAEGAQAGLDLLLFGMALSTLLSLLPQIGEQADYLRFLPRAEQVGRTRWWLAMLAGGPGWTLIGGVKLLLGSALAAYVLSQGGTAAQASEPTTMFQAIFTDITGHSTLALVLTVVFVITCQLKINVTNAYAGSIAWSNFFARITHHHPGRVVWLLFNVAIAMLLLELGLIDAIESILILYAAVAAGWIGALAGDLMISKPLGLSPAGIEFKRAHLYDINPVGVGALILSIITSVVTYAGLAGPVAQAFAPLLGLAVALVAAPALALLTHSRYYTARTSDLPDQPMLTCVICENRFERHDMAHCPVYAAPICSLCCTLESHCHDRCKSASRASEQAAGWLERVLPRAIARHARTPVGHFVGLASVLLGALAAILLLIHTEAHSRAPQADTIVTPILWTVFLVLGFGICIGTWVIVLAHESRRAALTETEHHVTQLEDEVAAHRVTDRQLKKAKEAAEAANAAKSRYLASVSHEIRSPLNAIYGYAQLLERGADVAPVEAAKVIRRSSEHLTNLVEGLLDIAQVESGVLRLSRDAVRLPAFLDQLVTMFQPQAQAKGITFLFDCPDRLPEFVRTDQKRLRQILINLLSNAIKFTDAGTVTFRVRYRNTLATFEIADTGIGIAPADTQRIFEPFARGEQARARQGVGLGLSISQALVQILGGELTVASGLGKGSTFTLKLMLAPTQGDGADPARPEHIIGFEGPPRRLLLIDDDPAQLAVLRNLLEPLGFAIATALDGSDGLAQAAATPPDLVVLDITMPGLTGWETAQRLRATHGQRLRIIMVSADAHEFRRGGDGQADHDFFLVKPVDLAMLLDAVAAQLRLTWRTGPPADPAQTGQAALQALPEAAAGAVAEIARLARIGHVRGIERELEKLARIPGTQGLVGRLTHRLEAFDLKGLRAILAEEAGHER